MPDGARPRRRQLLPRLIGKSRHRRVVDGLGYHKRFIAPKCFNVRGLAFKINRVFGIGFELSRYSIRNFEELRPDASDLGEANVRIRQQIEGAAAVGRPG